MTKTTKRLMEYLVIVAVVAILAAVLFPVYATSSRGGPNTRCLSNLKQVTLAQLMYASDHDDRLPLASRWYDAVVPVYTKRSDVGCPLSPDPRYGYAMLERQSGLHTVKVKQPEMEPLLIESVACIPNAHGDESLAPRPGRHKESNMVGYVDGHVKRIPTE